MIWYVIFQIPLFMVQQWNYVFPDASTLPSFLGVNLDSIIANGVGYTKAIIDFFPPMGVVMDAALIYFGFRVALLFLPAIPIIGKIFVGAKHD